MERFQAERQLILLSSGTITRRQTMSERAAHLATAVDWRELESRLATRRLLPTLGPRILELAEGSAGDTFAVAVEHAVAATRRQGAFLQLVSTRVKAALAENGIRCTALKGPNLGEAIYGDPGRRVSSDVDLLVAPGQLSEAVDVVRELGYLAPTDYVQDSGLPLLHFVLLHERGELPPVELHWRIHWYEQSFASQRLLAPVDVEDETWRPALADELASLLLFYARDGFIDLRLATDLGAWWDMHGLGLAPGELDELFLSFPELVRAVSVAAKVAERMVGLPATEIIQNMPRLGFRDRMALRLANPNPSTSPSQLYADMGLIDGLLTPPGGFGAFVRRQLLPPAEVLNEQARHAAKLRARSALSHCTGVLTRYALTTARVTRSSEALR
jgi:hypothetical protein